MCVCRYSFVFHACTWRPNLWSCACHCHGQTSFVHVVYIQYTCMCETFFERCCRISENSLSLGLCKLLNTFRACQAVLALLASCIGISKPLAGTCGRDRDAIDRIVQVALGGLWNILAMSGSSGQAAANAEKSDAIMEREFFLDCEVCRALSCHCWALSSM